MNARDLRRVGLLGEEEIDEAGARDLGARHERARRQRARRSLCASSRGLLARGFREAQRDVGRKVAVLRIARALDERRHRARRAAERSIVVASDGAQQKLLEVLLHEIKIRRRVGGVSLPAPRG